MKRKEVIALSVAHLNNVHILLSSTFLLNIHIILKLKFVKISEIKSQEADRRRIKERQRFRDMEKAISPIMFRRMFRMPKEWFKELCQIIERNVGKEAFMSETYIAISSQQRKVE